MMAAMNAIFHICHGAAWRAAQADGRYHGSDDDRRDGFIHFSAAAHLGESAAKYHTGKPDLVLLVVDAERLGDALKWEPSRGGALFPHLYAPLPVDAVTAVHALTLDDNGIPIIPPEALA